MGDITDLFSTTSKTKVTPTKSYIASFNNPADTNEHDTGITLSVPNNHYYAITFQLTGSSTVTATARLYEGASVKQTFSVGSTSKDFVSTVFQNTSGSSVTVKLTLQSSSASPSTAGMSTGALVEGINILRVQSSNQIGQTDFWAFLTSIDFQFSGQKASAEVIGFYGDSGNGQTTSSTTAVSFTVADSGHFIDSLKFFIDTASTVGTFVAYDWSGKIMVV